VVPDGRVARDQQRVFAGVPAQEMRRARVRRVVLTAGPDFMQEVGAGVLQTAMQIVLQAAVFLARGADQSAKLGFQEQLLALSGAQNHDHGYGILWEFDAFRTRRTSVSAPSGGLTTFGFGHVGGIVLQT
jgi:hypothetical protein